MSESMLKPPEKVAKIKSNLRSATDLAMLPKQALVVADKSKNAIKLFDSDGQFQKTLVSGINPHGVTSLRSGLIALTHARGKDRVVKLYTPDGRFRSEFGQEWVWEPRGIHTNHRGQIIVTDINVHKHSVGVYSIDGRSILNFGSKGEGNMAFNNPLYVTTDAYDRIIVSDKNNHCVKVYDNNGKHILTLGGPGSGKGSLKFPHGAAADAQGNIMVCDTGNQRIPVFSKSGKYIQDLLTSSHGIGYPFGIDYSRSGRLIVSNHASVRSLSFRKIRIYQVG